MSIRKSNLASALLVCATAAIVWVGKDVPGAIGAQYDAVAGSNPWTILFARPLLPWLGLVVSVALLTLWSAPGWILVQRFGKGLNASEAFLCGIMVAFGVHIVLHPLRLQLQGSPTALEMWVWLTVVASSSWIASLVTTSTEPEPRVADEDPDVREWVGPIVLVAVAYLAFFPKLQWEDFAPDGVEALLLARSLNEGVLTTLRGTPQGLGMGMVAQPFPGHAFLAILEVPEFSMRLPLLLGLAGLYAGIMACVRVGGAGPPSGFGRLAIAISVFLFAAALTYSGSYYPYFGDAAAPAAFESLTVLFLTGQTWAFLARRPWAFMGFSAVALLSRPTGLLWLLLLGLAGVVANVRAGTDRGLETSRMRTWLAGLVGCMGVVVVYGILTRLSPDPASDHALLESILSRIEWIRFNNWERWLWVAIPCGFMPIAFLFAWPSLDRSGLVVAVACLGYFFLFYFLGQTSLHQFAPVMVLPMIPFWRWASECRSRIPAMAMLAPLALSGVLSFPRDLEPQRRISEIGQRSVFRIGEFQGDMGGQREAMNQATGELVRALFPPRWEVAVEDEFVINPAQFIHYATGSEAPPMPDYAIVPHDDTVADMQVIHRNRVGVALVRSRSTWEADRRHPPSTDFGAPLLRVSSETLFSGAAHSVRLRGLLAGIWGRLRG